MVHSSKPVTLWLAGGVVVPVEAKGCFLCILSLCYRSAAISSCTLPPQSSISGSEISSQAVSHDCSYPNKSKPLHYTRACVCQALWELQVLPPLSSSSSYKINIILRIYKWKLSQREQSHSICKMTNMYTVCVYMYTTHIHAHTQSVLCCQTEPQNCFWTWQLHPMQRLKLPQARWICPCYRNMEAYSSTPSSPWHVWSYINGCVDIDAYDCRIILSPFFPFRMSRRVPLSWPCSCHGHFERNLYSLRFTF